MSLIDPNRETPSSQKRQAWLTQNQMAWDRLAVEQHVLAQPAEDTWFENPLSCVDRQGWLGPSIAGWHVLCLAAGGGRHGPLYAAAGAQVTVVDLSAEMLRLDHDVARHRKLNLRTLQTSMDQLDMLEPSEFDLVIHPVSTCYLADIAPVYQAIARVLRPGGLYISQHKQPVNLQADLKPDSALPGDGYRLRHSYYRQEALPVCEEPSPWRERGTQEFIHRWEELVGWMCRAGFVIEDLMEPLHAKQDAAPGTQGHRSQYVPPYVRIKARRVANGGPISIGPAD